MKTNLERKLRASLKSLVPQDARIVVGVSGGADSLALAHAMVTTHHGLMTIAHLNHLLRGDEADADAEFVRNFAAGLGINFVSERIDIALAASTASRNLEAVAREVRYSFLSRAAHSSNSPFVATAHTRDDQIETIFMRLMRGTGPEGLRGIHIKRPLEGETTLVRPVLDVSREEVLEYCELRDISFRSDSSNANLDLVRNRIRVELLPHLRSFNPRLDEALLRIASLVGEDDEKLTLDAEKLLKEAQGDNKSLKLGVVNESHPSVRRRVLRLWLRRVRGDLRRIDAVHLGAVEKLALEGEGGKRIELPGGLSVVKQHQSLLIEGPDEVSGGGGEENRERSGAK